MKYIEIKVSIYNQVEGQYPDEEDKNFEPQSVTLSFEDEADDVIQGYVEEYKDAIIRMVNS